MRRKHFKQQRYIFKHAREQLNNKNNSNGEHTPYGGLHITVYGDILARIIVLRDSVHLILCLYIGTVFMGAKHY